ncbi:uncharacterized protein LOC134268439, partial [Saccostrea cucullata]|uniref:uncharacterized protein LOC134268439 n=1 Tax=Saccostrea cuccullata TaxID=36930 RepID=UPI002ED55B3E
TGLVPNETEEITNCPENTEKTVFTEPKIVNLSQRDLNSDEIKLLEHGLKFTPTPKSDKVDVVKDTEEFCRKLRLKEFFQNKTDDDISLVKNRKGFRPPPNRDKHLEDYISCLKKAAHSNMADKKDNQFYKKLEQNTDRQTMLKIKKLTKKYQGNLTKNEIEYLTDFEVKTSHFYGLPKIHKCKEIQENVKKCNSTYIKLPRPNDLKLRPIIAGPASSTQRLSNLLDIILKPLCTKVTSYVRDDMDFLNYIPQTVPRETLLVSFDVTSLYTNITHELGIEAIKYWLDKYPEEIDHRFPANFILEGLRIVLENNNFLFDDENYLQIKGTAMGTKVAPTYACLVMGFLEEKLYNILPETFDLEFTQYIKENWKRYLDDCFIFWTKSEEDLTKFHSVINELHDSINFTSDMNRNSLPFLDILLTKNGEDISTDLFCKETDTHQYLDFRSCHPSHTKRNIPYNMARRICTIVTDSSLRLKRLQELKQHLTRQNYPMNLIEDGINRAKDIPLTQLRNIRHPEENDEKIIPFVITHNPRNHNILNSAKRFFPILEQSENMKNLLDKSSIINSRRQAPNLKRILTKAKFSSSNQSVVRKCSDPRCGTCDFIQEGEQITLKNGKVLKPNTSMNCKSSNLIYCAICPTCGEYYIGQTNQLNARVRVHKQHIRDETVRCTPCSEHFAECGKGKFKIFPFYKMWTSDEIARVTKRGLSYKTF